MTTWPSSNPDNPFPNKGLTYYPGMLADTDGKPYGVTNLMGGKPWVISADIGRPISAGKIDDIWPVRRFGHNHDVSTSIWESLWHDGGTYIYLSVADEIVLYSDDAKDTSTDAGGPGAQTVYVHGLDSDWVLQSDTFSMLGTVEVTSTTRWLRIFKVRVTSVGSSDANIGEITMEAEGDSDHTLAVIDAGEGESAFCGFTVPLGQQMHVWKWTVSEASLKGCKFSLWSRPQTEGWHMKRNLYLSGGAHTEDFPVDYIFDEKTDVEVKAQAVAAGAEVSAAFAGVRENV